MNVTAGEIPRPRGRYLIAALLVAPLAAVGLAISLSAEQLLTLVGVLAAVAGLAVLIKPDLATVFFIGALYANVPVVAARFHGIPRLVAAATIGVLLIPLAYHILIRRQPILLSRVVPLILALVVLQTVSTLLSDRPDLGLEILMTTVSEGLILYLLLVNVVRTREVLRWSTWALIGAGAAMGALSATQRVTRTFDRDYGGFAQVPVDEQKLQQMDAPAARAAGPIGEKNYYAQFLLLVVPLAVFRLRIERGRSTRLLMMVGIGCLLAGIACTESRGAAVGLAVMIAVLVVLRRLSKQQFVVACLVAIVFLAASPGYRTRLVSLVDAVSVLGGRTDIRNTEKSVQGRASEMLAALAIFSDHPVVGAGPGSFPSLFVSKADELGYIVHGEERLAHCAVLEIAAEMGILGVLCIAGVLLQIGRELVRGHADSDDPEMQAMTMGFLVSLILLVVTSFFLSFAYVRYYWMLLALATAAARLATSSPDRAATASQTAIPSPEGSQ